ESRKHTRQFDCGRGTERSSAEFGLGVLSRGREEGDKRSFEGGACGGVLADVRAGVEWEFERVLEFREDDCHQREDCAALGWSGEERGGAGYPERCVPVAGGGGAVGGRCVVAGRRP